MCPEMIYSESRIILIYKLPLQPLMLGLRLGLNFKIYGLSLEVQELSLGLDLVGLDLAVSDVDLVPYGLVNITAQPQKILRLYN